MRSPKGYELTQFAGDPADIETQARAIKRLGRRMELTAEALTEIADSDVNKSKGTDALAEDADAVKGDLAKAAIRYTGTGEALLPYAAALEKARNWYTANAESVRDAETEYQSARNELASAPGIPVTEEAQADREDAQTAVENAEGPRNEWWDAYETVFEDWEDAYEKAADGIRDAIDAADNDDGWFDFVADVLTWVGRALVVLAVVALFVVAQPWATIIFAATVALSAVHLAGTIYLYANGKASMSDVIWSGIGLATCGLGPALSRLGRGALPLADDVAAGAAQTVGPRLGTRIANMPGAFSRHGLTSLLRGTDAARLLSFGDDLANLGSKLGKPGLAGLGGVTQALAKGASVNVPAVANFFTGLGVGSGSDSVFDGIGEIIWGEGNADGLLPSFGHP